MARQKEQVLKAATKTVVEKDIIIKVRNFVFHLVQLMQNSCKSKLKKNQ